jgi:hypothetical protein
MSDLYDIRRRGPTSTPPPRRSFTLFRDIEDAPRKTWLVRDLFGDGELSFVYGAPGSGKSVVVADIAAHVAAGLPWCGKRVTKGAVLYIAAERGALVKRRLAAWRKTHELRDIPLAVVADHFDLWSDRRHTLEIAELARRLADATGEPVRWIIIDTVAQCLPGGDENSGKDMGALVANLAFLQRETGAHVTGVHHVPHGDQARMRGHGVLLGAADSTFSVEKDEDGRLHVFTSRKANDGPEGEKIAFQLESVELSTDAETGDVTTAPVVVPADKSGQRPDKKSVRLSDPEENARRALIDAVETHGQAPPVHFNLPASIRVVRAETWRTLCEQRKMTESDKPDTLRRIFSRVTQGLQRKGVISVREGWAWLI